MHRRDALGLLQSLGHHRATLDFLGQRLLGRPPALDDVIELADDPAAVTALMPEGYRATPERAFFIDVIGWEWNCSQHITPRFTEAEISAAVRPMAAEINQLRAEIAALRAEREEK